MNLLLVGLNVQDKRVVIFGGGRVGERKAEKFSEAAREVLVVSRVFTESLKRIGEELENLRLIRQEISRSSIVRYVSKAFIVVPATNSRQLNSEIGRIARKHGVLVNRVDELEDTDLISPAVVRRGDLQIAVSTSGKSPAFSRFFKRKIENLITDKDLLLLEAQVYSRRLAKRLIHKRSDRKRILYRILNDRQISTSLKQNDLNGAKARAETLLSNFVEAKMIGDT